MMNAYKWGRLASEFVGMTGPALQDKIEGGVYTMDQVAAMCSTRPDHLANRLAWWTAAGAPFDTPPVVIVSGPEGA